MLACCLAKGEKQPVDGEWFPVGTARFPHIIMLAVLRENILKYDLKHL